MIEHASQSSPEVTTTSTTPAGRPGEGSTAAKVGMTARRSDEAPAGDVEVDRGGRHRADDEARDRLRPGGGVGPVQGFGRLWQKRYGVRLDGVMASPQEIVATWKAEFATFWPRGNRFYGPLTGIAPGEVALLNLAVAGGQTLSTGVMVIYADDESFTFMTPEGHMFAAWITFSALVEDGTPALRIDVLLRTNDPFYELTMALGGHRQENEFWLATLHNLARRLGSPDAQPTMDQTCVDRRRQWRRATNIRHNAALRSGLYMATHPLRWFHRTEAT